MKKLVVALLGAIALVLSPIMVLKTTTLLRPVSKIVQNPTYVAPTIPTPVDDLEVLTATDKAADVKKTITLEASNMVVLRGPVTGSSVAATMKKLSEVSNRLSAKTPIYLVLDTPGGSIMDGMDLIDYAAALPQKVHTVTLFAASMGFQIAQNLDTRYIVRSGQLMSHRAAVSGLGGQIKGEFETRYRMIRRMVDYLDFKAYSRMGVTAKDYENMILHEYWVFGYDAVKAKVADEEVLIKCGTSLSGSEMVPFDTMFGRVEVTFSQCPMIKTPEKIDFTKVAEKNRGAVAEAFELAFEDKTQFIQEYITTNRFFEVFR